MSKINTDKINHGLLSAPALEQTTSIKCEKCGCEVFMPAYLLRKVSKLLIGAQSDGIVPINVFSCVKCKHINSEFIPSEIEGPKDEVPKSDIIM